MIFQNKIKKIIFLFSSFLLYTTTGQDILATFSVNITKSYDNVFTGIQSNDVTQICNKVVGLIATNSLYYYSDNVDRISPVGRENGLIELQQLQTNSNLEQQQNEETNINNLTLSAQEEKQGLKNAANAEILRNKEIYETTKQLKQEADKEIERNNQIQEKINYLENKKNEEIAKNNQIDVYLQNPQIQADIQRLQNAINTASAENKQQAQDAYNAYMKNLTKTTTAQDEYDNYVKNNKISTIAQDAYNAYISNPNNIETTTSQDAYNNYLKTHSTSTIAQDKYNDYISTINKKGLSASGCKYYYNYVCVDKITINNNNKYVLVKFSGNNKELSGKSYYCDVDSIYESTVDNKNETITDENVSYINGLPRADDIYTVSENNGLATAICKAIDISTQLMVPLFAIMFSVLGLKAYQGKLEWSLFVTFAVGIAAFKSAGAIMEFFMPDMGLQYGCKCATSRYIRDSQGIVKEFSTGLNEDCTQVGT